MPNLEEKLSIIEKACEDKKGIDIKLINIQELTPMADYFVIVSGNSSNQVMSIADEVQDKMAEIGYEDVIKEGYSSGRWVLIDYNDIVVHIFHKEERDYYDLERLWSGVKREEKE